VDQHVDALTYIYEVVARAGVSRDRDRASAVIEPVPRDAMIAVGTRIMETIAGK
jgi:hypothetical protein